MSTHGKRGPYGGVVDVDDPYEVIRRVTYDPRYTLATFQGPGGFTQQTMSKRAAAAIALALSASFEVHE